MKEGYAVLTDIYVRAGRYQEAFFAQKRTSMLHDSLASAEVRNMLAQGYLPITGADGRRLLLVQSPRALRGGFSFIF